MEYEKLVEFVSGFNIQTIISMAAIVWFFSSGIKSSIDNLDKDIRDKQTRSL